MVRLKEFSIIFCIFIFAGFNSKMVRLKDYGFDIEEIKRNLFQFQNGAIKSYVLILHAYNTKKFQFQNGAIKSGSLL